MGYAVYEDRDAADHGVLRWAGYGVPGKCDHPECDKKLSFGRGLANKCEYRFNEDEEDDISAEPAQGCGLYFCGDHLPYGCDDTHDGIVPKPDTKKWVKHMLKDSSWERWRAENPERVEAMKARLE